MDKLKKDLVKKLSSGHETQENHSEKQNIKYRSSTPWTTLLAASLGVGDDFNLIFNPKAKYNFDVSPLQAEYIFNASIEKCIRYLTNESDEKDHDYIGDVTEFILKKKLTNKSLHEIIYELKKLRPYYLRDS